MSADPIFLDRRTFLLGTAAAGAGLLTHPFSLSAAAAPRPDYRGPNVILIRWGGGARRRESIDLRHTYAPFLTHELTKRGVLFPKLEIAQFDGLQTSHGEGTLNLITGKYDRYRDIGEERADTGYKFLGARFEAKVPTVFEYLRAAYDVADHQALIINGEDRADEEFYNFSNHHLFGVGYRSQTLSLRRYKTWLLRQNLAAGKWDGKELKKQQEELKKLESFDYRASKEAGQGTAIENLWAKWRGYYGDTGLVNPRGDRLLTELTLWSLRELRPRLVMVNYQDCDYVHWGYLDHYTRAVAIMDEGVRTIVTAVENDPFYRDNTVFVVVPCQHHFGSRSAHEIFALAFGSGIARGVVVDQPADQTSIAGTVGQLMGFKTPYAESRILEEVFA